MFEPATRSLRTGGRHIVIASTGDRRVSLDLISFYQNQSKLIGVKTMKLTTSEVEAIADEHPAEIREALKKFLAEDLAKR